MRPKFFAAIVACSLIFAGCNKKEEVAMAPMGESAPMYGSKGMDNPASFIVGRWAVIEPLSGLNAARYYDFKADGTFETAVKGGDYVCGGKWTATAQNYELRYETMNGKSYEDFRAQYKKDEEGGGQVSVARALFYDGLYSELDKMRALYLDEDKKHLSFSPPQPEAPAGGEMGEALNDMMKNAGHALERMAPVAKE